MRLQPAPWAFVILIRWRLLHIMRLKQDANGSPSGILTRIMATGPKRSLVATIEYALRPFINIPAILAPVLFRRVTSSTGRSHRGARRADMPRRFVRRLLVLWSSSQESSWFRPGLMLISGTP